MYCFSPTVTEYAIEEAAELEDRVWGRKGVKAGAGYGDKRLWKRGLVCTTGTGSIHRHIVTTKKRHFSLNRHGPTV